MIYLGVPNENWSASEGTLLIKKNWRNKILGYAWISLQLKQVKMRITSQ
jgi:hypothetical protein